MRATGMTYVKGTAAVLMLLWFVPAMAWDWWPVEVAQKGDSAFWKGRDSLEYAVAMEIEAGGGEYAPFLMHSNRNGRYGISPFGGYMSASIEKKASSPERWYDYDLAVDVTAAAYSTSPAGPMQSGLRRFPEWSWRNGGIGINSMYAHARLYIIDVTAGIRAEESSLPMPDLSIGGLLFSGNARPMPGVSVGIDHYTPVPGLYGYLEVKGHLSHQWITDNVYTERSMLHYLYVGGRAGGKLPVHLSYEIQHIAQWGGYSPVFGDLGNDFGAYWNAIVAGAGGTMGNDQLNAQGNHIVVQQAQLDVDVDAWHASAYWQTLHEDNSMAFMLNGTNMADGLWGVTLSQDKWPYIKGVCVEYLGTTDQTGPFHDQDGLIYAGNDNYYKNYIYQQGWSYRYRTIGTPYITSPIYNQDGRIYTANNRVKVWHAGLNGDIYGYRYRLMASHARNYGSYDDGDIHSLKSRNTALLLEVKKHVEKAWGMDFGVRLAADFGDQFGNNYGLMLSVSKSGLIKAY